MCQPILRIVPSALRLPVHLLLLMLAAVSTTPAQESKPILKDGFLRAVEIGGLSSEELAGFVQKFGVDFALTDAERQTLRKKGVAEGVLEAVRASYRGAAGAGKSDVAGKPAWLEGSPLSKEELLTELKRGTAADLVEKAVENRGIQFAMSAPIAQEFGVAGATRGLIGVLLLASAPVAAEPPPSPSRPTVNDATPPVTPASQPAGQSAGAGVNVPMAVQAARLLKQAKLAYPYQARREKVAGAVRFEAVIREDGTVERVLALSGHPLLVAAAEESVRKWIYQPAMVNGKAAKVTTEIEVRFAAPKE